MPKQRKERNTEKIAATSTDFAAERAEQLRSVLPEAFSEGKIDFGKLRDALGDLVDDRPERYSFTWAGKRDAIRLLQTPSRATLVPCPEESVNFDTTQHLFIEGDNLEVLKLLYKSYAGRVKLIYIDPPYNTGNDFIYPDNFADPLDTYLRLTGQKDENGNLLTSNPESSGRYHSTWLSMMYPRLFVARQLLRDDGLIFVSIDDNEVHNLRLLMNEVFGEENFVAELAWKNVYGGGAKSKHVVPQHEYVLLYARSRATLPEIVLPPDPEARKRYTDRDEKYDTRGPYFTQPLATTSMDDRPNLRFPIQWQGEEIWPEKQWQWSRERVESALQNNELVIKRDNGKWSVRYKQYLRDDDGIERGSKLFSVKIKPWSQEGTAEIVEFFGNGKVFPFPKPSTLIRHFVSALWHDKEAIILDFFAGSCPTAQAVLDFNREFPGQRKFIMVQLPEQIPEDSPALGQQMRTIADIGKQRIRKVIQKLNAQQQDRLPLPSDEPPEDLGFRVFKLSPSHFRAWSGTAEKDADELSDQMELFDDPLLPGWDATNLVYEALLKEGYGLTSRIEKLSKKAAGRNIIYRVTDDDRDQSFFICLDNKLDPATPRAMELAKDDFFICRDIALDDELAANLALQCRLKTI